MTARRPQTHAGRWSAIVIALCLHAAPLLAQPAADTFAGRRLEDALRLLQTRGVRIVFSSELVTPDMRVQAEPRAAVAREQLRELLEPHGLAAENGPGGVVQIVRQKKPAAERPRSAAPPAPPKKTALDDGETPSPATVYRERVTVTAEAAERDDIGAAPVRHLSSDEIGRLGSAIADDPLRVVQSLPGVASGDDFRSEYSVRGSQYRQAGVVIDGVVAPWLQHAALGRGDTGTMTMLGGDMIEDATLLVGAYARRDSSQLGPQLNLTLREGSRTATRFRLGVSGTSAIATAEGPVGSSARGSWLVGVRRSHSEWPVNRSDHDSTVFGFSDAQSKLVYDVRDGQQLSLSIVAGVSNVEREDPGPFMPGDGVNRAAMATLAWRSAIGPRTVVTQRLSSLTHDFHNDNQTRRLTSRGTDTAAAYRVDVRQPLFRGVVEAGGQVRQVNGSRHSPTLNGWLMEFAEEPTALDDVAASWLERSGHVSFQRALGPARLAAGFRVADSTLVHHTAVDRWLQAEWSLGPRWLVHGSTGVLHQFPALEQVAGWTDPANLRPERATSLDLGIGQRLSDALRWDATVFVRRERDALRAPHPHPRVVDGILAVDATDTRFENALAGTARGIELTLARRSESGLSGWIGYAYGVARHTDVRRAETFAADFDQRHAINVSGSAALPRQTRLSATFRGGTNFPIPGYLIARDDQLYASSERNRERLPAYARLDLRLERTFDRGRRRFTLFAEALNVLNRVNVGPADGVIVHGTGRAVGFTEPLFPRLLTAGLRFEF